MLQINKISKKYQTGDLVQTALNCVSLNLRDNEFVAILGPSGSGKTTLLNVIGGLDRYDDGDLIINSISTKKYKDRDWDSYRNHTIGFIFQSYNLIPHQSVLANVELALTISGISRSDRRKKARKALEEVGLGDQLHKKPNQMSGGQMQRVAIARALVNDPSILLADEPTGALDTETSVQVMELLKEVARDRLVVMVTHNPELAEDYATRIVKLRDGNITDDSNPFDVDTKELKEPKHKNMGKSSMSFLTSLSLSFNNLRTKKGRTLLTSFAGSIGIIGIALILSLSAGVNGYIEDIQKSTMASYPIIIDEQTVDMESMMLAGQQSMEKKDVEHGLDGVYINGSILEMQSQMTTNIVQNNLSQFKKYLENERSAIHEYVGESGIVYSYATKFNVFSYDENDELVNADGSTFIDPTKPQMMTPGMMMMQGSTNNFEELMPGANGEMISSLVTESYDVVYGEWPKEFNEIVLILDVNNEIQAEALYELGILPSDDYKDIKEKIENGEEVKIESKKLSYEDLCEKEFYMIPESDTYVKNENGLYKKLNKNSSDIEKLFDDAIKLKISGVIKPKADADYALLMEAVGYTKAMTDYVISHTHESQIVKDQVENMDTNIISGVAFTPLSDEEKAEDTKKFISTLGVTDKANLFKDMMSKMPSDNTGSSGQMPSLGEAEMAAMLDKYLEQPDPNVLLSIYDTYISAGTFDENLKSFGVVNYDAPSSISIYADSFDDKDQIAATIKDYNKTVDEENQITYTDPVALLMSSVTTIVNVISYVLIAFVAVSLIVSSIMIGIITYISVLERTKEIGILRAIGASKHNITQVFNAETFIIGLCSGLLGVGISALLLIPGNAIIHAVADTTSVSAKLPFTAAVILVVISVLLTCIGGLIPSKKAAKKDPVIALRTE